MNTLKNAIAAIITCAVFMCPLQPIKIPAHFIHNKGIYENIGSIGLNYMAEKIASNLEKKEKQDEKIKKRNNHLAFLVRMIALIDPIMLINAIATLKPSSGPEQSIHPRHQEAIAHIKGTSALIKKMQRGCLYMHAINLSLVIIGKIIPGPDSNGKTLLKYDLYGKKLVLCVHIISKILHIL